MKRAFIICGPESVGNRLLAAILLRAGCWGSASHNQPSLSDFPDQVNNIVWIKHFPSKFLDLIKGFEEIVLVIPIREPEAHTRSMVRHGHAKTLDEARKKRLDVIATNIAVGLKNGLNVEILTYEGLSESSLKLWLERFGLRTDNLDEPIMSPPFQNLLPTIANQNAKHYEE